MRLSRLTLALALSLTGLAAAGTLTPSRDDAAALHRDFLAWEVGTWRAEITTVLPDGSEVVYAGEQTDRLGACGLWLITDLALDPAEGVPPYEGHGVLGFDPARGKLVGMWADPRTDWLATAEGEVTDDGKRLLLLVEGRHPMTGEPMTQEWVTTKLSPDRRRLEVFMPLGEGGGLVRMSRIEYERR